MSKPKPSEHQRVLNKFMEFRSIVKKSNALLSDREVRQRLINRTFVRESEILENARLWEQE